MTLFLLNSLIISWCFYSCSTSSSNIYVLIFLNSISFLHFVSCLLLSQPFPIDVTKFNLSLKLLFSLRASFSSSWFPLSYKNEIIISSHAPVRLLYHYAIEKQVTLIVVKRLKSLNCVSFITESSSLSTVSHLVDVQ